MQGLRFSTSCENDKRGRVERQREEQQRGEEQQSNLCREEQQITNTLQHEIRQSCLTFPPHTQNNCLQMERPHYLKSVEGIFPHNLKNYQYITKPPLISTSSSQQLTLHYDPSHSQGLASSTRLDFRYWKIESFYQLISSSDCKITKINFSKNSEVSDELLPHLEKISDSLLELDLGYCQSLSSFGFSHLSSLHHLQTLSLNGCSLLRDTDVHGLTRTLPQLTSLSISHCSQLTNQTLLSISSSPSACHLLQLFASSNPHFTFHGTNPLLLNCSQLSHLDLSDCPQLTFIGINITADTSYSFNEKSTIQYVSCHLRYLSLASCPLIVEECLDWIASACPDLSSLNLSNIPAVTNQIVQGLVLGCPHLQTITLRGCKRIDSEGILPLSRCLCRHELTVLDLGYIARQKPLENIVVQDILHNCSVLTELDLSGHSALTDSAFMTHSAPHSSASASLKLRSLILTKCSQLTSLSVISLTSRFHSLQILNLSHLTLLADDALQAIALNCRAHLLSLNLSECLHLTDHGLDELTSSCTNLRELYLGTNVGQTDAWGGRVTQYSDHALQNILRRCRKLIVLDLRNQCGITLTSSWFRPTKKKKETSEKTHTTRRAGGGFTGHVSLQQLNLFGCDKLSRQSLARMLSRCYALNHVTLPQGPIASGVPILPSHFPNSDTENETPASAKNFLLLVGDGDDELSIPDQTFESYHDEISVSLLSTSQNSKSDSKSKHSSSSATSTQHRRLLHSQSSALSVASSTSGFPSQERKEQQRQQLILHTKKQFWMTSFRHCRYATSIYHPTTSESGQLTSRWGGLFPHPLLPLWSYRDAVIQRRLEEQWACRKIQTFYHFVLHYRQLKVINTVKYLQRWFRHHHRQWQLGEIKDRLYLLSCVLTIQRHFRKNLLPLLRHTLRIQKLVRGWRGRVLVKKLQHKHLAAKAIQKIARGMIIRLSDRYILTQIYMKLPPFWKTVIHSCAPEDDDDTNGVRGGGGGGGGGGTNGRQNIMKQFGRFVTNQTYSDYTKHYHILKTTRDVQAMVTGIEKNRQIILDVPTLSSAGGGGGGAGGGGGGTKPKFKLRTKLPYMIPQSFDKKPYVSRGDGRKLAFYHEDTSLFKNDLNYSDKIKYQSVYATQAALTYGIENITKSSQRRDKEIHQYTFTFWPLVSQTTEESQGDTTLFDPMVNHFDLLSHSHEKKNKIKKNLEQTLHCELCGLRLRLIFCHVCCHGYCFFCAFKAHLDGTKRNHRMDMMEPRVVEVKEADTSLIYHLDMAQKTTYDIK
jgi:hypothetical protein